MAAKGDNGVQVIDITNPYAPDDASHPTNGSNGFTKLGDPVSITTIAGSPEYALVSSFDDHGIQIMRINTGSVFESNNQNAYHTATKLAYVDEFMVVVVIDLGKLSFREFA